MQGNVNKLFVFKSLLTMPSNVFPLHLKQTFPPITWIFMEGEGDVIDSRLPFKIFSTLRIRDTFVIYVVNLTFIKKAWNTIMTVCMKGLSPNPNNVFVNSVEKYSAIIKGLHQVLETWTFSRFWPKKKRHLKAKIDIFLTIVLIYFLVRV